MSSENDNIPKHIAIIMDGNGRWAKSRNLPRWKGHEAGAESVREVIDACIEANVQYLTLYAFSTENWNRPKPEVTALMKLLEKFLTSHTSDLQKNNVKLQAIGRLNDLTEGPMNALSKTISETRNNTKLNLILALSYGAREEIVDAVNNIIKLTTEGNLDDSKLTTSSFEKHLYTKNIPDPDLLIRTSGEMRISNFLLWQISYSEIFISNKLWPDFNKDDLFKAIDSFAQRDRRYGEV
ncbi:MAG: isoprenyl transferase [Verrucomicrobiales bacterium]|nr:isoprenyl transferase [Verrucomicrobiales bacterium]